MYQTDIKWKINGKSKITWLLSKIYYTKNPVWTLVKGERITYGIIETKRRRNPTFNIRKRNIINRKWSIKYIEIQLKLLYLIIIRKKSLNKKSIRFIRMLTS